MSPIKLAILGCGSRGRTYARLAAAQPDRYRLTAAADPVSLRTEAVASLAEPGAIQEFSSAVDLFAGKRLADILIIATQDATHFEFACTALEAGYDLLLEKPAGVSLEECEQLDALARRLGRRIALCFVLRYSPFYQAVKRVIDSGRLGRIITMRFAEGVEPFHQAHSFVRGHWSISEISTPMIVAKCSHDADLVCWLGGAGPKEVSSFGDRSWFRAENTPLGATARCTDGCPHVGTCRYDSHRYLSDKRRWLTMVMDHADSASDEQILAFLRTSPWGRCAWQCDNDVVDHQVVATELENGITATLTMTAFDQGRTIEIHGTEGSLRGGDSWHRAGTPQLWFTSHDSPTPEAIAIAQPEDAGYAGHGGGDAGLIHSLADLFYGPTAMAPGLDGLGGHQLAFRAEKSRVQVTSAR